MFRAVILTILSLTTLATAAPPPSLSLLPCFNKCLPYSLPCNPIRCVKERCYLKFLTFRIHGFSCRTNPVAPSATPTPAPVSTTPPTAVPTTPPTAMPPTTPPAPSSTLGVCSFDIDNNLKFSCDCTDNKGSTVSANVDLSTRFSGSDRRSKSCFESCLFGFANPKCQIPFSKSAFEDAVNDNVNFCCSGQCDVEISNGVCVPLRR